MRFKQGQPVGALKKIGPARGTGTTRVLPARLDDLPEDRVRPRDDHGSASRSPATCTQACGSPSTTSQRDEKHVFQHAEGLADYLKTILKERTATPVHDAAVHAVA